MLIIRVDGVPAILEDPDSVWQSSAGYITNMLNVQTNLAYKEMTISDSFLEGGIEKYLYSWIRRELFESSVFLIQLKPTPPPSELPNIVY